MSRYPFSLRAVSLACAGAAPLPCPEAQPLAPGRYDAVLAGELGLSAKATVRVTG